MGAVSFENRTVGDVLREAASRWGDRPALISGLPNVTKRRWTFAELGRDAEEVARALLTRFRPGEHVAVWAGNEPEWILLEFGAALAGLTLVTVNPAYGAEELAYVLHQSQAVGVVVQAQFRSRDLVAIATGVPGPREVISMADWDAFLAGAVATDLPEVAPDGMAQIQFTSGTTGFTKGAMLAHRGLVANGRLYAEAIGVGARDVWVNPMPLFHTAGCGLTTLGALQTGGTQILPPGFDAATMLDLIAEEHGTVVLCVPTMALRMLDEQRRQPRDLSSWRLLTVGGAPVPPELIRRAEHETGVTGLIGFGQTESSPYITHTVPGDPDPQRITTVGRALPTIEVKIVDPASGEPRGPGQLGEICTRSVCVMLGYFNNPDVKAVDDQGWLHTGDLGTLDTEGYLQVQGRLTDVIIRGGENVYPREIEAVLLTHPAVSDVAVAGIPDEEWGEIVAAFVIPAPGTAFDADDLIRYCREHLAGFKVPRAWYVESSFPLTASGKVQKFVLLERAQSQTAGPAA
ncbi:MULTISPECIES: AMP-binding protein [unclassified Streptomyces]|uniref:AMP-binding protein n=1 Tax=unclassified Streptomyces TaxID=2593676 RepID=UPI00081D51EB|nr:MULTISPECIES: AMP-binding protein [unclassified Streptomyces]MYZ34577.1 AMP-binding protein [Streptomyces sp. SID4917]SCF68404.1 fatty-acyl-CoA synthase [Streptomyces sp. MnatMP-M17]